MTDREKIIERCKQAIDSGEPVMDYVFYYRVIKLLKEQKARILSWDEIKDYPVVYGEFKGVADIYPLIITLDNFGRCLSWNPEINVSSEYLLLVSDEEDRKNTRCWNVMPTDEQRQAVRWE